MRFMTSGSSRRRRARVAVLHARSAPTATRRCVAAAAIESHERGAERNTRRDHLRHALARGVPEQCSTILHVCVLCVVFCLVAPACRRRIAEDKRLAISARAAAYLGRV